MIFRCDCISTRKMSWKTVASRGAWSGNTSPIMSYYRAAHGILERDGYARVTTTTAPSILLCYGLFCLYRSGEEVVRMLRCFDLEGRGVVL
jgi:hypothetical protein